MAAPHSPPPRSSTSADWRQDPVELATAKAEARRAATAIRAGQNPAAGQALAQQVLACLPLEPGIAVAGYWPMGDEIDIRPLLDALHERGHPIGLPVTGKRGEALIFRRWHPGAALSPGPFGTQHPEGPAITPAILFIPLLAFDRRGFRLGYGGGFYDRTLAALPGAVGIGCAYAVQECEVVPVGPHDRRLQAIATEQELRRSPG